jgi:hypothetical protein
VRVSYQDLRAFWRFAQMFEYNILERFPTVLFFRHSVSATAFGSVPDAKQVDQRSGPAAFTPLDHSYYLRNRLDPLRFRDIFEEDRV